MFLSKSVSVCSAAIGRKGEGTELAGFAGSLKRTELAGSAGSLERTAYAHIRLYKTGKRTDREGKGRERTARDKVHREEALGRAWLTFSGSLWSFREGFGRARDGLFALPEREKANAKRQQRLHV